MYTGAWRKYSRKWVRRLLSVKNWARLLQIPSPVRRAFILWYTPTINRLILQRRHAANKTVDLPLEKLWNLDILKYL